MSSTENTDEGSDLNTNNSSKTTDNTVNDVIARSDDTSNLVLDDVEEIPCSMETVTSSDNVSKPDVYQPPTSVESDDRRKSCDETGSDKWALPSPQTKCINGADKSQSREECCSISNEKLPSLEMENSKLHISNDTCSSGTVSLSPEKQLLDGRQSVILSSEDSNKLTVELPSIDGVPAKPSPQNNEELHVGAEESLKPDVVENTENRSFSSMDDKSSTGSLEGVYQIKWIKFKGIDIPIITQNENGPCPLLALMNVLLLKGQIKFPSDTEIISSEQIMAHLGECILANKPQNVTEVVQLNYEQNMHDAIAVFHKLQTGLDVNVRFNGVNEFEYTPECIIFDLLGISLYHGWLVDPQNHCEVSAIGNCSYNQLVEKIICQRSSDNNDQITEALVAEGFLDRTASQLTYHGLCELSSTIKPEQLCVFFRNNHFCTLYRHKEELFLLVTDQGFLHERSVVWETLNNVEGDHYFVDSDFHTYTKPAPTEPVLPLDMPVNSDEQVNHDYLLAMSLQQEQQICVEQMEVAEATQQRTPLSDAELAARLQAEEDAQAAQQAAQQPQHHGNPRVPPSGYYGQQRSRERDRPRERDRHRDRSKEKDSSCSIL